MGSIKEKIKYIKETKKLIREAIIARGVDVPENTTFRDYANKIDEINLLFTGSYDNEGLKQIGWTDSEISYYNRYGVQWDESENSYFKLTSKEIAGDESKETRFLPKTSEKKYFDFHNYYYLIAIPLLDISIRTNLNLMFGECYSLTTIPKLDTSKATDMSYMFGNCYSLTTVPQLDTSNVTNISGMFSNCTSLTTIPQLNTSNVTNINGMFAGCYSLKKIPQLDTSKATNMGNMFDACYSLKKIPQLNTNNVTNMSYMFESCRALTTIPKLNTNNVTNMSGMFKYCWALTTIPQIDTSKVTDMSYMFQNCNALTTIPKLDTSNVTNTRDTLYYLTSLKNFGGLLNLGQAYSTSLSANYYTYGLELSNSTELTHESLMNVINGLYDIKTKGCKSQQLVLGATNLAKLTTEEIAIATNKGWSVS